MTTNENLTKEKSEEILLNLPLAHKKIQTASGWKNSLVKKRKPSKTASKA